MKKIFETKDKHEFKPLIVEIEDKPTSPLAKWLFYIIVSFLIITIAWLYIGKVDIVVSAQGKALPSGEIKIVQSLENGVIKDILVYEGEEVKKGQTIMLLDPSINNTNQKANKKNKDILNIEIKRLESLIQNKDFNTSEFNNININMLNTQKNIYTNTKQSNQKQKDIIKEQISQTRNQIKSNNTDIRRLKKLLVNINIKHKQLKKVIDIIAKQDYEDVKNQQIEYIEQIKMKEYETSRLKGKLKELSNQNKLIDKEYKKKLLEEKTTKINQLTQIQTKIDEIQFTNEKQFIKSPVDGYVGKLLVHTKGGIVTPAQKLISIIPKDAPLIFKVNVLNQDIGFIKEGMEVSVKIDTFNFQKYGLINSKITHISNDAIEDEKLGLVYEVFIKPDIYYLEYKNKKHKINSGMSVTAEVKIGKRRVVNFFIYPLIRYMDEGMSVR